VLQARLKRTVEDARRLAGEGANIRLCKGIYQEPAERAHTGRDEIRDAYVAAFEELLGGASRVGIATHDRPLIRRIEQSIAERDAGATELEFQALLGVPVRSTLERLRDAGYPVRLYVPFGDEWYAYSVRRLRENPQLAGAIARGLFSRDRLDPRAVDVRKVD
jgi:proline dehydrogenase